MLRYRNTIQFEYPEFTAKQEGLIVDPEDKVDLYSMEPGFDVGPYISVDLRTVTELWLGLKLLLMKRRGPSVHVG